MDDVSKIIKEIKAGQIKPIYFLMGDEPYYIDKVSEFIEQNVLPEEIEEYLGKIDIISECVVVGRTNKETGEVQNGTYHNVIKGMSLEL